MALKILLADDSMVAQNMGKKILTDAGYEVTTVSNGAAAVKKLPELSPDLVLLDVYMPGYSGLEVCERVKTNPATARTPVLLTVGKLEPFRPEDGMRAKADGIIIKPFEATDLIAVVGKLAERVRAAEVAVAPAPAPAPVHDYGFAEPEAEPEPHGIEIPQEVAGAPAFSDDMLAEFQAEPAAPVAAHETTAVAEDAGAMSAFGVEFADFPSEVSVPPVMALPAPLDAEVTLEQVDELDQEVVAEEEPPAVLAGDESGDVPPEAAVEQALEIPAEAAVAAPAAEAEMADEIAAAEPEVSAVPMAAAEPASLAEEPAGDAPEIVPERPFGASGLLPEIEIELEPDSEPVEAALFTGIHDGGVTAVMADASEAVWSVPETATAVAEMAPASDELPEQVAEVSAAAQAFAAAASMAPVSAPNPAMSSLPKMPQTAHDDDFSRLLEAITSPPGVADELPAPESPRTREDLDEALNISAAAPVATEEPAAEPQVSFGPDVEDAPALVEEPLAEAVAAPEPVTSDGVGLEVPAESTAVTAPALPEANAAEQARAKTAQKVDEALAAVDEAMAAQMVSRILERLRPELLAEIKDILKNI